MQETGASGLRRVLLGGLFLLVALGAFLGTRPPPSVSARSVPAPAPPSVPPPVASPARPRSREVAPGPDVRLLGSLDRTRLGSLVPTADGALALEGELLLRLGATLEAPEVVADDVRSARLRVRAQQVFFLAGPDEAPTLGIWDPRTRGLTRHPLPGLRAPELLFVYQDLRTLIVADPAPQLYRVGVGPLGSLPRPPGCSSPELVGPLPRSRAVLDCDGQLHLVDFSSVMPFTRRLGASPGPDLPAPGEALVEPDRDLWPVRLTDAGPGGGRLVRILPASDEVPPPQRQRAATRIAGADLVLLEVAGADGSRTVEVTGPGLGRAAKVYARGALEPVAAHLPARSWVVWWEAPQLVVLDLGRGRLGARLTLEGEVAIVPGRYQGPALPISRALPGAFALDWLVAEAGGSPRLVAGPRELGGVPVVGASAAGAPGVILLLDDGKLVQVAPP